MRREAWFWAAGFVVLVVWGFMFAALAVMA
jgi:hypothetical protein